MHFGIVRRLINFVICLYNNIHIYIIIIIMFMHVYLYSILGEDLSFIFITIIINPFLQDKMRMNCLSPLTLKLQY